MDSKFSVREAVDLIDGHIFLTVETAREVCAALEISFDEALVISWQTQQEAWEKYGFVPQVNPGSGIDGLRLSYHVAKALGIEEPPGRAYIGTGKQAQANKQAIRQKLSELGKL